MERCGLDLLLLNRQGFTLTSLLHNRYCVRGQRAHKCARRVQRVNLVHRVTTKLRPVKLQQAVSESLPNKGTYHLYWTSSDLHVTCLNLVPSSIRARNAQEMNITNCDVTTRSWVNLVNPSLRRESTDSLMIRNGSAHSTCILVISSVSSSQFTLNDMNQLHFELNIYMYIRKMNPRTQV